MDTLNDEQCLELARPDLAELHCPLLSILLYLVLGSHCDQIRQDLINLVLLNGRHIDGAVFTHGAHVIASQGLLNRDLVASLVPSLRDRTSEYHHEVFFLDHLVLTDVVIALQEDVNLTLLDAILRQS